MSHTEGSRDFMQRATEPQGERRYRFGQFEFGENTGRLWRNGLPVRLQSQPGRVLGLLLAAGGDVVTREQLQRALWPDESFGDFDTGLNTAIRKLRQALDDSPQNPRFVETLPRLGYRFLAPITRLDPQASEPSPPPSSLGAPAPLAVDPREAGSGDAPPDATAIAAPTAAHRARLLLAVLASRQRWLALTVVVLLLFAALALGERWRRRQPAATAGPLRLQINLPAEHSIPTSLRGRTIAISPDGAEVFYVAEAAGTRQIFRRRLDSSESRLVPGTEGATALALSPDGAHLAFHRPGELWLLDLQSFQARKVALPDPAWQATPHFIFGADGSLIAAGLASTRAGSAQAAAGEGNTERPAQEIFRSRDGKTWHRELPSVAPSSQRGEEFRFPQQGLEDGSLLWGEVWSPRDRALYLWDPQRKTNRLLAEPATGGHITRDGILVYFWQGALMAKQLSMPSDGGARWTIARDVLQAGWSGGQAAFSSNGSLVYLEAPPPASVELVWVDKSGNLTPIPAPARPYSLLDLSSDGDHLLVGLAESAMNRSIWSHSLITGEWLRLVDDAPEPPSGIWSPGRGHALVSSYLGELRFPNIAALEANGKSALWRLSPSVYAQFPQSWPAKQLPLAFMRSEVKGTSVDLGLLYPSPAEGSADLRGEPTGEPLRGGRWRELIIELPDIQRHPAISPDGKWLAFTHGHVEDWVIRVCALPGCKEPVTVSGSQGGESPVWEESGKSLFFRIGKEVHAARLADAVNGVPVFEPPVKLFEGDFVPANFWNREMLYDRRTGRFLLARPRKAVGPVRQIHVVLNWRAVLEDKGPGE